MVAVASARKSRFFDGTDQHIFLSGKTWTDFEVLVAIRGENAGPRLYYLDGVIELMSLGGGHEDLKKTLARLLEHWAFETRTPIEGYGSWLLKSSLKEAGAEPDECYIVGTKGFRQGRERPDLAIEIDWSRGSKRKQEIYQRLGVSELWLLDQQAAVTILLLEGEHWRPSKKSRFLPQLDVAWLASFLHYDTQTEAVGALHDALRRPPPKKKSRSRA